MITNFLKYDGLMLRETNGKFLYLFLYLCNKVSRALFRIDKARDSQAGLPNSVF